MGKKITINEKMFENLQKYGFGFLLLKTCPKKTKTEQVHFKEQVLMVRTSTVFSVMYLTEERVYKTSTIQERSNAVKQIYYIWCYVKGLKANKNEGWFKSKKYNTFLTDLGYDNQDYDYVMLIEHIKGVENETYSS